jgi:endonuclease/exonuclease/phosphatase family metal-dependent hydrolase
MDCAYDRIIVNNDEYKEVISADVVHIDDVKGATDHYPVYVELNDKDK